MRLVCAVVLAFEVIVIALAIPVAINLEGMDPSVAGSIWGGMAAAALVLSALQRYTWAHYAAWLLQAVFLFSAFMVSGMLLIAVVFVSLWVIGVVMGRRVDEARAAHARVEAAADNDEVSAASRQ